MASAIYRAVKEYKQEYEKESGVYDSKEETIVVNSETKEAGNKKETKNTVKQTNNDVVFRVQFYTSPGKLQLNDKRFKSLQNIFIYQHNGLFKYTTGEYASIEDAEKYKKVVKGKGFGDAFTVAFHKGSRVSIAQAKNILNEK